MKLANPRETKWSSELLQEMKKCNATVLSIHGHGMQAPGWPDAYIAHTYYNGFIEFKGTDTKVRGIQKKVMRDLKRAGTHAYVVRYPNLIQTEEGVLLRRFDGTGKDLLVTLATMILGGQE